MKRFLNPSVLVYLPCVAGGLTFLTELWLHTAGVDDRGLLVETHPAFSLIFVLTGLFFGALALLLWQYPRQKKPALLFPASLTGAVGCWVGAAGVLCASIVGMGHEHNAFPVPLLIMGILAALALTLLGYCRLRHLRPTSLAHIPAILFTVLYVLAYFRSWSILPQLPDYFFRAMAGVFLILSLYYRSFVDSKGRHQRMYVFFNRSAVFFCIAAVFSPDWLFFLPMAVWTGTDLCAPGKFEEVAP